MRKDNLYRKIKRTGAGLALLTAALLGVQGVCSSGKICVDAPVCKKENAVNNKKTYKYQGSWNQLMAVFDDSCTQNQNAMLSPLSLDLALGMAGNGASETTRKEISGYLGQEISGFNRYAKQYASNSSALKSANSIWATSQKGYPLSKDFKQLVKKYYGAEFNKVDFGDEKTVGKINGWISRRTEKMIPSVLDKTDDSMKMILVNALYFGSDWDVPFESAGTSKVPFHSADGNESKVDMMHQELSGYFENDAAIGFEKSYQNGEYSFVAVLPKKEGDFQLKDLQIKKLLKDKKSGTAFVGLPRFKFSYQTDLTNVLRKNGISEAFDSENGRFDRLFANGKSMYISNVIQATKIRVDEKGTEAAAATVIVAKETCAIQTEEPKEIILDRPFAFLIMDNKTKTPLFVGKVVKLP